MSATDHSPSYAARREKLADYFDRTASETWARLTSDAPVSRIRQTVRAGRDAMRATLLGWLPQDLSGRRLLDAGCGTGALAVEAAARGAEVVAVDVAGSLVALAQERAGAQLAPEAAARIRWEAGDMLDPAFGRFDHVVAMDSLIHYPARDIAAAIAGLAARASGSVLFTIAPRTPLLTAMHTAGKLFPRGDRSPAIEPVAPARMRRLLAERGLATGRSHRVAGGFYISQALEVTR
ncbi:MAG: magnesium protoporphyrin IX methyltransferase [Pseudomonadota bacterium]